MPHCAPPQVRPALDAAQGRTPGWTDESPGCPARNRVTSPTSQSMHRAAGVIGLYPKGEGNASRSPNGRAPHTTVQAVRGHNPAHERDTVAGDGLIQGMAEPVIVPLHRCRHPGGPDVVQPGPPGGVAGSVQVAWTSVCRARSDGSGNGGPRSGGAGENTGNTESASRGRQWTPDHGPVPYRMARHARPSSHSGRARTALAPAHRIPPSGAAASVARTTAGPRSTGPHAANAAPPDRPRQANPARLPPPPRGAVRTR